MDAINCISHILNVGPWELGIFSTSCGLVYGNLMLHNDSGEITNCFVKGGELRILKNIVCSYSFRYNNTTGHEQYFKGGV